MEKPVAFFIQGVVFNPYCFGGVDVFFSSLHGKRMEAICCGDRGRVHGFQTMAHVAVGGPVSAVGHDATWGPISQRNWAQQEFPHGAGNLWG